MLQNCVDNSAVFDTTMYRDRDLMIRVSIQLALYRYCGTCTAVGLNTILNLNTRTQFKME